MIKALFKLLLLVVALYVLMQIPLVRQKAELLKAALLGKVDNVTTEYNRVKGEVDNLKASVTSVVEKGKQAKETLDEVRKGVTEITEKAVQTGQALSEAAGTVEKVIDAIGADEKTTTEPAAEESASVTATTPEETPDSR